MLLWKCDVYWVGVGLDFDGDIFGYYDVDWGYVDYCFEIYDSEFEKFIIYKILSYLSFVIICSSLKV